MYDSIPDELKDLDQWMNFKYVIVNGKQTKKPISPYDLVSADWRDEVNHSSFSHVVANEMDDRADGIGLVLRPRNRLVLFDLDNKPINPASESELLTHMRILKTFSASYWEYSLSTTEDYPGYHGIIYDHDGIITQSFNRQHVEARIDNFCAFTGWPVFEGRTKVINGFRDALTEISHQFGLSGESKQIAVSQPMTRSDDDIWHVLENAKNCEKLFKPKQGGDSETDYDIACLITKMTRNKEQAIRLFLRTPYAWGKKSDGKVLAESNYHLSTLFDRALTETQVPDIDISRWVRPEQLPAPVETAPKMDNPMAIERMPEGWCKEFARFTVEHSMSPLEEAAVLGSFLPVCGVGGRMFNVSNTGLNQQFTLLALTGTGKDEAVNATAKVIGKVTLADPSSAIQAFVADDFGSAQAVHRALSNQQAMFGYNKEQGLWMQNMSRPNPNEHAMAITGVMLDIYNLSGPGLYLKGRKYAKKENDIQSVASPCLSTLSASTPRKFFDYISVDMLENGIVSRELVFECEDTKAKTRPFGYLTPEPPPYVVEGMCRLAALARRNLQTINGVPQIGPFIVGATPEAEDLLNQWGERYISILNADNSDIHRAVWNRANLKMRKLAATLAVSHAMMVPTEEMAYPIIAVEHVNYAVEVVNYCSAQLEEKLLKRGVGNLYIQQEELFDKAVEWYFSDEAAETMFSYVRNDAVRASMQKARLDGVIFKTPFTRKCAGWPVFSGANRSTAVEFERTLKSKVASGMYAYIDTGKIEERYGTRSEAFVRVDR
jgi:hypothetical protein